MAKKYWLFKSEEDVYSIDDLEKETKTTWEGVRNYQVRNFIRDEINLNDEVLFYHSNSQVIGVVGLANIVSKPYPDQSAFDKSSRYYDPKSQIDSPTWFAIDVGFTKKFERVITLQELKLIPNLEGMILLQKGSRLSIQPVSKIHFNLIKKLGFKVIS